jgi:hypothetical protein
MSQVSRESVAATYLSESYPFEHGPDPATTRQKADYCSALIVFGSQRAFNVCTEQVMKLNTGHCWVPCVKTDEGWSVDEK